MPPPRIATVLPISPCASGEAPARTTTPAPSLPTGIGLSRRAARPAIAAGGMRAVTTGWSGVPDALAAPRSGPANSRPWSDGLIGEASIRTRYRRASARASGSSRSTARGCHRPSPWRELKACIRVGHESPPVPRRNVVQSRSRLRSVSRACAARRRRVMTDLAGPVGVNPPPYRRVDADTAGD